MRWTLLLVSLAAATIGTAASSAPTRAPDIKPICRNSNVQQTRAPKAPAVNKLGDLPPGSLILSVMRQENGCTKPVVVRYGSEGLGRR